MEVKVNVIQETTQETEGSYTSQKTKKGEGWQHLGKFSNVLKRVQFTCKEMTSGIRATLTFSHPLDFFWI